MTWFSALRAMSSICGNSADVSIVCHDFILSNSTASRVQTTRCTMMQFSLVDSAINWLCLEIEYCQVISTSSCSYCIWNRYCQNHRSILPNFLLVVWFDTGEFKRLPCSNNKIYDDVVFDYRFGYKLTMFEVCILIGLSRLLDTHIAYEIAI